MNWIAFMLLHFTHHRLILFYMGFVHVDKIPENGGQTLKEFLIDNHVDIGKFESFTSKHCASEDCAESENKEKFTRICRKTLRLELINYPISDSCWNNQVKSALSLLREQIFYSILKILVNL